MALTFVISCRRCPCIVPVFKHISETAVTRINIGCWGSGQCPACGQTGRWSLIVSPDDMVIDESKKPVSGIGSLAIQEEI